MRRPKSPHNETLTERLARYVEPRDADKCWSWNGFRNTLGYGRASWQGKLYLAHRLAWMNERGPIPEGIKCLHRCDNPPCCNPAHLFLGTDADNTRDMVAKGRRESRKGEDNGHALLTNKQVRQLRSFQGSHAAAARKFNISDTHAARVRAGDSWSHLK